MKRVAFTNTAKKIKMNVSKKVLLFGFLAFAVALIIVSCSKGTVLPKQSNVNVVFAADPVHHTKDSVSVGDTLTLTASGVISDTTQNIYVYLISTYTGSGLAGTFTYGTTAVPVKVARIINVGSYNSTYGLYNWTATLTLTGATTLPHKTTLTITGNYIYQLSTSSVLGSLAVTDAGVKNKTIYIK
jgi:hypothetical protein